MGGGGGFGYGREEEAAVEGECEDVVKKIDIILGGFVVRSCLRSVYVLAAGEKARGRRGN